MSRASASASAGEARLGHRRAAGRRAAPRAAPARPRRTPATGTISGRSRKARRKSSLGASPPVGVDLDQAVARRAPEIRHRSRLRRVVRAVGDERPDLGMGAAAARLDRAEALDDAVRTERALDREQRVDAVLAQAAGELGLGARRRPGRLERGRAVAFDEVAARAPRPPPRARPARSRRPRPASTSRSSACRESRGRRPARSCRRNASGGRSANAKAPETAHSSGAAACSNTCSSEASRRIVRGKRMAIWRAGAGAARLLRPTSSAPASPPRARSSASRPP